MRTTHVVAWLLGAILFYLISIKLRHSISIDAEKNKRLHTLNLAVEQIASGVLITNEKAEIEYVNDTLLKITGYNTLDLVGKKLTI